jgi:FkbM family methyltransferase
LSDAHHISRVALAWRLAGMSPIGVLYRLWMWQLWRRTIRRTVTIRCIEGSLLLAPPWSRMASHIAATGLTERDEALFVLDLLRPHDLFVDVGANIGFYTVLAARRGSRVLAFEPSPDAIRMCRRSVELNGAEALVTLRNAACGAAKGRIGFSTGLDTGNHIVAGEDADLEVELTTLDRELATERPGVTMLKIDAEGHDLDVLRGSIDAVTRLRPVIMVEVWRGGTGERRLLEPLGYGAYRYRSDDRLLESVPLEFAGQANLLFVYRPLYEAVANRLASSDRPRLTPPAIRWQRAGSCDRGRAS